MGLRRALYRLVYKYRMYLLLTYLTAVIALRVAGPNSTVVVWLAPVSPVANSPPGASPQPYSLPPRPNNGDWDDLTTTGIPVTLRPAHQHRTSKSGHQPKKGQAKKVRKLQKVTTKPTTTSVPVTVAPRKLRRVPAVRGRSLQWITNNIKDVDSLLFRINVHQEEKSAIVGGPLRHLTAYRNPCWLARKKNVLLRCLPLFYSLGGAEGGAADVARALMKHPDVVQRHRDPPAWWSHIRLSGDKAPTMKFVNYVGYFDADARVINSSFENRQGEPYYHPTVTVDSSTSYLTEHAGWRLVPANRRLSAPRLIVAHSLHLLVPDARFFPVLMDPIDRLYIEFHKENPKLSPNDFHRLVSTHTARWRGCAKIYTDRVCAYNTSLTIPEAKPHTPQARLHLEGGLYELFLADWFGAFPRKQFYIIKSEEYVQNKTVVVRRLFDFLKLTAPSDDELREYSLGGAKHTAPMVVMHKSTRKMLTAFYRPFNKKLVTLLKDKKFDW